MALLKRWKLPDNILSLIARLIDRVDDVDGVLYRSKGEGLAQGCALSPLLGAIYLYDMDQRLGDYSEKRGLKYYRYMDDWVVLCKTRHQLREVVKLMHTCLNDVKQTTHPDKTYIGKIKADGFDFLGYQILPANQGVVALAQKTIT
ncbi:hypothetical protein CGI23_25500, partial [Vibrio parahaemolyticus]